MTTMTTRLHVPTAGRHRAGGWFLVAAQFGFTALYAFSACLGSARAAELTGQWYVPSQGDGLTDELDVIGGWPWAALVTIVVSSGFVLPC
ncbi:hypothetical protein M1L60_02170 [Actinoplanes sp. TRM 88003]|uniref:Uncharacterized protein n=1 Tax=Paractinoplanes aksuensis TaxID=2939490 RepID=A0ABT1DEZ1_9ACTN|nr:hypothetical protein [Actinoplanes aksuensis]MCO8269392.1 hypothetical protein [Actinoplanes aksuensis]